MFTEFRTDSPESEQPISENQPDPESTMLIEVDTANPSPMTIALAEAIAYLLANRDRYIKPAPKRRRRRQTPASQPSTSSQSQSMLSHHARHCTICHHPERQAIEEEFIHWHRPKSIASDHAVGARSVYRHARALGLFERRAIHLRDALGHIIEKAENASITADTVVRAVYAHAHLSPSGQWIKDAPRAVSLDPSESSGLLDTPVE
ncbi:MAG TPA: hypothetical protein VGR97_06765 [Candidatus Acidoferrales bacterium]|nr:hypothetical protein [Candidatus Acidoferrales bacterium]